MRSIFMKREHNYYVYIIASKSKVLYIGVTNSLVRRIWEHKNNFNLNSFSCKYHCHKLVYFEHYEDINAAIAREKQMKKWRREKKVTLIEKENNRWADLSNSWS